MEGNSLGKRRADLRPRREIFTDIIHCVSCVCHLSHPRELVRQALYLDYMRVEYGVQRGKVTCLGT